MFDLQAEQMERQLIVRWIGELDHHMAEFARSRMEEQMYRSNCFDVLLDLSGLRFMDSAGLGVLLGRYRLIKANRGKLMIFGAQPQCVKLLELSGVQKLIPVFRTKEQALTQWEVYQ